MKIFIDTNILIDFLLTREPFYEAASKIMKECAKKKFIGYITFHSISNLWYILRKVPEDIRRKWMIDICGFLEVASISHDEVVQAIKRKEFKDFEDCLQDACAKKVGAEYIITRNTEDFKQADITVITPEEFISILNNKE